ncbi:MAG: PorP/SprF family type IX secretion system membrane protein [Bacteroidetes bacterium]|nr:PorP/SprF family type IX secretion system membrane protein [Bacteroidota bacterium]
MAASAKITDKDFYSFRGIIILLFCLLSSITFSQDIHYSQFNASIQNLNPGQTGLFDGDWRFAGNHRSQWAVIPVPYKTSSIATDTRLKTKLKKDAVALGLIVNADKSGDSKFTTTQIFLSAAYIKKLNSDSTHFLSIAIQPGITSKNFNLSELTFDSQYDGDKYNPALSSQENFNRLRITYFDVGGGLVYLFKKNYRKYVNIGISAFHLTKPKQSFFDNRDIKLDVKTTISGIAEIPITAKIGILPTVMYEKQGKFHETLLGGFGKYYLKPVNGLPTAVSLGAFYRLKDAFILAANMDYRNLNVGLSYDINTSKLIEASNHRGGFEISIIYIIKKIPPFIAKKRVCPIYM